MFICKKEVTMLTLIDCSMYKQTMNELIDESNSLIRELKETPPNLTNEEILRRILYCKAKIRYYLDDIKMNGGFK